MASVNPALAIQETIAPARANGMGTLTPADHASADSPRRRGRRNWKTVRKRLMWSAAVIGAATLVVVMLRPTPLTVDVAAVRRGPLQTTIDAEGITRVHDRFTIAAPIAGRLQRITLRAGDSVSAGMVLARIAPPPLDEQALAQAQAGLAAAQAARSESAARVAQTREAVDQAERSTARVRAIAREGAVSVDAVERAELQLASARRDYEAAVSRTDAAAAEVAVARAALLGVDGLSGRVVTVVRSPLAGRVLRVHEQSERVIPAGTTLLELGDPTSLEVVVDVLSTDAVRIEAGARMRLLEWGGPGELDARVRLVEPSGFTKVSALGVEEQRVNVIADVLQVPAAIRDGYRVQAQIVTWSSDDVLLVPNSAVFRTGSQWLVFTVEADRARARKVGVGHRGARATEVLDGLADGERVIVFPSDRIVPGRKVRTSSQAATF